MELQKLEEKSLIKTPHHKKKKPQGFALHPELINKKGAPKKAQTLTQQMSKVLDEPLDENTPMTKREALARKVVGEALDGNETMMRLAWSYADGMPKQSTEISTGDKKLVVEIVEDTTLKDANRKPEISTENKELSSAGQDILEPN